jgi:hypothetical protein
MNLCSLPEYPTGRVDQIQNPWARATGKTGLHLSL